MASILISAYACEPGRGSEGEIGWSLVHELARLHDVWVITRANVKPVHDRAFATEPCPARLHFIYYDTPAWLRWYKRGKRNFLVYYYVWQLGSYLAARRLLKRQKIDIFHHLTGGMDWMLSGLSLLGQPFLWGPVGSENIHPLILRSLPLRVRLRERLRQTLRFTLRHLDVFSQITGRRADIILSHTPSLLPRRYHNKTWAFVQTGVHPSPRFAQLKARLDRGEGFNLVFAGELVHWKGAKYALEAFLAFAPFAAKASLTIIGDGPLRAEMEQMVADAGLGHRVRFLGKVPMAEMLAELAAGDVFLYPSYHHGLATVVLQAMLTGLPVICLEGDAIARAVGQTAGISVAPEPGVDFVVALAAAINELYVDEDLRLQLAHNARQKVLDEYTYTAIAARYDVIYRALLNAAPLKESHP